MKGVPKGVADNLLRSYDFFSLYTFLFMNNILYFRTEGGEGGFFDFKDGHQKKERFSAAKTPTFFGIYHTIRKHEVTPFAPFAPFQGPSLPPPPLFWEVPIYLIF